MAPMRLDCIRTRIAQPVRTRRVAVCPRNWGLVVCERNVVVVFSAPFATRTIFAGAIACRDRADSVSSVLCQLHHPYFPVNDPPDISSWPPFPGALAGAKASLQILGFSLGSATKPYAAYWGFGMFALGVASVATLARSSFADRKNRPRVLGLLLFLGAAGALVAVVAETRAGMGLDYLFQGHYLTLQGPALCAVYFIWEIRGRFSGRCIQVALFVLMSVLLPLNVKHGLQVGQEIQHKAMSFERDVMNGVPPSVLAERHFASSVVPRAEKLTMILREHKRNGIGIFRRMREDPPFKIVNLPVRPAVLERMTWRDGIAAGNGGGKSFMTYSLYEPRYVYAVRLRYNYDETTSSWPTLLALWRDSRREDFNDKDPASDERKLSSSSPGPKQPTWALIGGKIQTDAILRTEGTLTVWINGTIDQFRIYPDYAPCEFRLSKIELLVPEPNPDQVAIR